MPEILDWISGEVMTLAATLNRAADQATEQAPEWRLPKDPVCAAARLRAVETRAADRLLIIGELAAECRARSARGAMLQLALAEQCVGDMLSLRENEAETHFKARQAGRLLYSIMAFMERRFRLDRREVVGECFMGRHRDPDQDLRLPLTDIRATRSQLDSTDCAKLL